MNLGEATNCLIGAPVEMFNSFKISPITNQTTG